MVQPIELEPENVPKCGCSYDIVAEVSADGRLVVLGGRLGEYFATVLLYGRGTDAWTSPINRSAALRTCGDSGSWNFLLFAMGSRPHEVLRASAPMRAK